MDLLPLARPHPALSKAALRSRARISRRWFRLFRLAVALAGGVGALCGGAFADDPRDELLATDRAFSVQSSLEGRVAAFVDYAAPDALLFRAGGPPIEGIGAIRVSLAKQSAGTLSWNPHNASVADSGELGYTWGDYQFTPGDSRKVFTGHYVSIWKRQSDGRWKWVVDIGNPGAEPSD